MKKTFLALFFGLITFYAMATEPPQTAPLPDTALVSLAVDSTIVPDSICVLVNDVSVCLPTKDAVGAGQILKDFLEGQKGNWPKNLGGILVIVIGWLFSAKGTEFLSNSTKVYKFLKVFLRETLHVVIFIAMALAAGVTILVGYASGKGFDFDWQIFSVISPMTALLAIYIYERKKKKEAQKPIQ